MTELSTIVLRLDAPFAAWRWLQAGVFRGTFPVIPHSAAWGLALNLAGIETRGDLNEVTTPILEDAPSLAIAVALERYGIRNTIYQQLHAYPVGNSGADFKARTRGSKYWIAPAKREVLSDVIALVGVRGPSGIVNQMLRGLDGDGIATRYGLPFAGDNQFLFSKIEVVKHDCEADWFVPVQPGERMTRSTRLTTNIDRCDSSKTQAPLFAPLRASAPPERSWIDIGPQSRNGQAQQ